MGLEGRRRKGGGIAVRLREGRRKWECTGGEKEDGGCTTMGLKGRRRKGGGAAMGLRP